MSAAAPAGNGPLPSRSVTTRGSAAGVIVCPGVTIGDNTVIGAGSVVIRDIPDQVFAAGNPARILRRL
jgi:serine acetyltransferase